MKITYLKAGFLSFLFRNVIDLLFNVSYSIFGGVLLLWRPWKIISFSTPIFKLSLAYCSKIGVMLLKILQLMKNWYGQKLYLVRGITSFNSQ